MASISVAQAARRLGVGIPRIHQRIADASLRAERIGSQWVIDEASLLQISERRLPGRPLSERSAWALIAASQGDERRLGSLAAVERSRARERLAHLLKAAEPARSEQDVHAVVALLRSLFRNRGERLLYRVSPQDMSNLREDDRIALAGLSHPRSGIASGEMVEGYVASDVVDSVIDDYLLAPVDGDGNVVLHVVSRDVAHVVDAPLLLAADLADHRGPREEARAVELLREITKAPRGDDEGSDA